MHEREGGDRRNTTINKSVYRKTIFISDIFSEINTRFDGGGG